jgi:hypothetical protein
MDGLPGNSLPISRTASRGMMSSRMCHEIRRTQSTGECRIQEATGPKGLGKWVADNAS